MAEEILYPDSEGAWICKKHKAQRGFDRYGSNCYRCLIEKLEKLQAKKDKLKTALH